MRKYKHLTMEERIIIQAELRQGTSFTGIAEKLERSRTTISREVFLHRKPVKKGGFNNRYNDCANRFECPEHGLCGKRNCTKLNCRNCGEHCGRACPSFKEQICEKTFKPPYVCSTCAKKRTCSLKKYEYSAVVAENEYRHSLRECRNGISISEEELDFINESISAGLLRGQSPYHVYAGCESTFPCSVRTIYRLSEMNLLKAKNIDFPAKVKYRPRRKAREHKVDRKCRIGRTFEDYKQFITDNPDICAVQMDSVIGRVGGKVLLTLFWPSPSFMVLHLRERNTAASVKECFDELYKKLGRDTFIELFPAILTDNGSEFSDPMAIEFDSEGRRRTYVFYCDPAAPGQKAGIEGNHTRLRLLLPKGTSFDCLDAHDIRYVQSQINSIVRQKLKGRTAHSAFQFYYGDHIPKILQNDEVCATQVNLKPYRKSKNA